MQIKVFFKTNIRFSMMQILLYTLKVGEIHTDMHYIKYKNIYFRVNLGVPPHFFPTPFDNTGFVFTKQGILYLYSYPVHTYRQ